MDKSDAVPSPEPAPDVKLRQSQEAALLQMALAGLPLESREVLILSRFQNLKYEEIATILDCGVGAVKMRVHRALGELREIFTRLTGETR
jgi:RNA polymerase sigma-70 factor (ECF subfamily)